MIGWTSPTHLALLLLIALLLFGAKRVPEIGRSLGSGMREFKESITHESVAHEALPEANEKPDTSKGHAADTFAFATALERHLGWKGAVPAYIFSSYVAMSRLPANRHWLSDVVFGSAVGIISGRTVTRHGKEFPVVVAAVPGGAAILYVRRGH